MSPFVTGTMFTSFESPGTSPTYEPPFSAGGFCQRENICALNMSHRWQNQSILKAGVGDVMRGRVQVPARGEEKALTPIRKCVPRWRGRDLMWGEFMRGTGLIFSGLNHGDCTLVRREL